MSNSGPGWFAPPPAGDREFIVTITRANGIEEETRALGGLLTAEMGAIMDSMEGGDSVTISRTK